MATLYLPLTGFAVVAALATTSVAVVTAAPFVAIGAAIYGLARLVAGDWMDEQIDKVIGPIHLFNK